MGSICRGPRGLLHFVHQAPGATKDARPTPGRGPRLGPSPRHLKGCCEQPLPRAGGELVVVPKHGEMTADPAAPLRKVFDGLKRPFGPEPLIPKERSIHDHERSFHKRQLLSRDEVEDGKGDTDTAAEPGCVGEAQCRVVVSSAR
jgi:hypothetical protein